MVYFGEEPYEARDGNWYRPQPPTFANRQLLISHFEESVNFSGALLAVAIKKEHTMTFNLLA